MSTERCIALLLMVALCAAAAASPAHAQTQWGQSAPPAWGQLGAPAWGQYQGTIGANGWQYRRSLQQSVPKGAILSPNEIGGGPATGTAYSTPDTRLLGRRAP